MTNLNKQIKAEVKKFNQYRNYKIKDEDVNPKDIMKLSYNSKRLKSIKRRLKKIKNIYPNALFHFDWSFGDEPDHIGVSVYPYRFNGKKDDWHLVFWFGNTYFSHDRYGMIAAIWDKKKDGDEHKDIKTYVNHVEIGFENLNSEINKFMEEVNEQKA